MRFLSFLSVSSVCILLACNANTQQSNTHSSNKFGTDSAAVTKASVLKTVDTAQYNKLMRYISNGDTTGRWPVKGPYPNAGAILPFNRIVAYYGNLFSKRMGVLGEYPKQVMLQKLMGEVKKWSAADSVIKAIPALHYIAITAQGDPGKDGKYRYRMPFKQIDTVNSWAKEINALVFIDIQVGFSTVQDEVPLLEKYLAMPNVHFGIDPEFALATKGKKPGTVIGTYDAADINYTADYLAKLVKKYNLPPKILIVHRFTKDMVTNYQNIKLHPEVQIVMDMDGWGSPAKKRDTYRSWVAPQPVQFTGFKLFYKNDTQRSGQKEMMPISEVLKLKPQPIYIQYQ